MEDLSAVVGLPPSLELRTVDGMGRGVFTRVSISAGATIFSALPIAHCSVEETRGSICEHCFKHSESLKKCMGCKFVHYCNRDCKNEDWPLHKKECKIVRDGVTPFVRLALRALTRHARKGTQHLCSVTELFSGRDPLEEQLVADIARVTKKHPDFIRQLCRKLICNKFTVTTGDQSPVGVAVYSAPSMLNNSCRPNTIYLFNERQLLLKAVRNIGPGEQLFITYTDTLQLHCERQAKLQSTYNFTCACERCLEDISQSPGCSDQLLLMGADGREVPSSLRQEMEQELTEIKELKNRREWQVMYDKCRALYTNQLTQLSPDNILRHRLMEHLFDVTTELRLWEKALEYNLQLLGPSLRHYGPLNPMSVAQLFRIGKLRRWLGTIDQLMLSIPDLTKARTAAERLYGAEHPVTLEAAYMLAESQLEITRRQQN